MASNGSTKGGAGGRGAPTSGFRGAQNPHAGGRGGGTATNRGGSGGPPHASRWGNGPPSSQSNNASANSSASHGQQNNAKATNQRGPAATPTNKANTNAAQTPAFPSLSAGSAQGDTQKLMHDRMMFLLVTLVGNPVTVTVKGGSKFFGIFSAANTEGGELSVALASAQQILPAKDEDAQPQLGEFKPSLLITYKDLETIEAAEVRMQDQAKEMREAREKEAFRTDTEISKAFDPLASGRTLQKWSDDPDLADLDTPSSKLPAWASPSDAAGGGLDESSASAAGKPWDQFAANEARFGIKSNYEENLYTTKLDRSGKDFRNREREADRIAREIMAQATSNPHLAEERGQADDSGVNEEDKYGAVVRSPNAYVPPALRKQMAAASAAGSGGGSKKGPPGAPAAPAQATPKSNGAATPSAAAVAPTAAPTSTENAPPPPVAVNPPIVNVKVPSPSIPQEAYANDASGKKPAADAANPLMGDFRSFVSSERERLEKKKAALAKKEKDTRLADLKSWASTFKLNTPMPSDVAGMVQKDKADGASDKPRDPSLQKSLSPTPAHSSATPVSKADVSRSSAASRAALASSSNAVSPAGGSGSAQVNQDAQKLAESKAMLQKMTIPKIPPFNPDKFKARQAATASGEAAPSATPPTKAEGGMPSSVSTSSFKLSAKASSFKPFNPNAASFTPGGASSTFTPAAAAAGPAAGSPATAAATPSLSARPTLAPTPEAASTSTTSPANPFFGNRVIKKNTSGSGSLHIREDFNAFKVSKVPDAKSVGPMWAFSGKPYRQHFVVPPPGGPMDDGTGLFVPNHGGMMQPGMHPGAQTPQPVPQPIHPGQMPISTPQGGPVPAPVPGPGPAGPGPQQPFGMVYQHYGGAPYQYPGGQPQPQGMPQGRQPSMVPPMQMAPGMQGAPMPYGAVPQQFMGQMPFSPSMHQHGAPQNMYSPQMGNVPPSGQPQFMPMPPPGAGGGPRPPPPQHLHQKGQPPPPPPAGQPPHMSYYPGQPGAGMPYGSGPHFGGGGQQPGHAGPPGAGGGAPPRQGAPAESGPASSAASSTA
ncbi:hypothetical protein EX895_005289 [Sporisorium graminicola]|uniref:LsmAD domain-containing protein n=1 Tax=Sporisorium graminicola TaxID=280036 RepID=A0A4V6ET97_9BASI|nr:hypothetical protein EX895_005289 [Sporisorium graminicola]TKY85749.1 hypothetical protein EX895_005289 [Sporisorium graminicola]